MPKVINNYIEQGKAWYYELVSGDIGERFADKYSYVEYFFTHKFKDDLLFIYDADMNVVWDGYDSHTN